MIAHSAVQNRYEITTAFLFSHDIHIKNSPFLEEPSSENSFRNGKVETDCFHQTKPRIQDIERLASCDGGDPRTKRKHEFLTLGPKTPTPN